MTFSFIRWITKKLRSYIGFLKAYPVIISGKELHSGDHIKLLYIGKDVHLEYLKKILFSEYNPPIKLEKTYCWKLRKLINSNSENCSLIIIENTLSNTTAYNSDDYFIPLWLKSSVPLPLTAKNKSAKSDVRLLNKNNLSYHVSSDIFLADSFYHNMYLPYISSRFAKGGVLMEYSQLLDKIQNKTAEILYVSHANKVVAGVVVDYEYNLPKIWSIGVLNAEVQYLQLGVVGACYFYLGKYLFENNYSRANFGYSRAFYNDGVFTLKRKWGISIEGNVESGFLLKIPKNEISTNSFLKNNPFVYFKNTALHGVKFIETSNSQIEKNTPNTHQDITQIKKIKTYLISGIKSVNLVSLDRDDTITFSSDDVI